MACTFAAMVMANSPFGAIYEHFIHLNLGLTIGDVDIHKSLLHWVNDGLMVIFFFVVGLEIKRELMFGELSSPRKAALPMFAALGGMIGPALIYYIINPEGAGARGWGIPMATDIAFAVGVISLLGKRVPFSLKVFLLALAIVDDLGAVLVIAMFYTDQISGSALGLASGVLGLTYLFKKAGVRSIFVYVLLGIVAWAAVLTSGIHATIAGVLLGFMTPATAWYKKGSLVDKVTALTNRLVASIKGEKAQHDIELNQETKAVLHELHELSNEAESPLDRLIHILHPWVSFFIMPVFALVNAGVVIGDLSFATVAAHPVAQGVTLGLFLGKPIGIIAASFLAIRFKLGQLPEGVNWVQLIGAGCLGGIGFTMALFISGLALAQTDMEVYSKLGILAASVLSVVLGVILLLTASQPFLIRKKVAETNS
jgi:NhaA family Na+:H+ antiporter